MVKTLFDAILNVNETRVQSQFFPTNDFYDQIEMEKLLGLQHFDNVQIGNFI